METLLAEEEEWESALGLPVGRGEGEKTNFSRKTGNGRRLRHQT